MQRAEVPTHKLNLVDAVLRNRSFGLGFHAGSVQKTAWFLTRVSDTRCEYAGVEIYGFMRMTTSCSMIAQLNKMSDETLCVQHLH